MGFCCSAKKRVKDTDGRRLWYLMEVAREITSVAVGEGPLGVRRRRGGDTDGGRDNGNGDGDRGGEGDDSDNDSGSWESIRSDEDSRVSDTVSKTDLIFRYFDANSYKLQQFEEPAFANTIDGA